MKKFYAILLAIGFLTIGALAVNGSTAKERAIPPYFDRALKDCTVQEGVTVQFSFVIKGVPYPKIEVIKNGTKLDLPSTRYRLDNEDGYVSFIINRAIPEDSGTYEFILTNSCGTASMWVTLTVEPKEEQI